MTRRDEGHLGHEVTAHQLDVEGQAVPRCRLLEQSAGTGVVLQPYLVCQVLQPEPAGSGRTSGQEHRHRVIEQVSERDP